MKRMIILVVSIGTILLLSTFTLHHTFPRSYHHIITKSTDLDEENIEGLFCKC